MSNKRSLALALALALAPTSALAGASISPNYLLTDTIGCPTISGLKASWHSAPAIYYPSDFVFETALAQNGCVILPSLYAGRVLGKTKSGAVLFKPSSSYIGFDPPRPLWVLKAHVGHLPNMNNALDLGTTCYEQRGDDKLYPVKCD